MVRSRSFFFSGEAIGVGGYFVCRGDRRNPFDDSRRRMVLTQPPVRRLTIQRTGPQRDDGEKEPWFELNSKNRLSLSSLYEKARRIKHSGCSKVREFRIRDGDQWLVLSRSVNEITGHEMLWLLSMQNKELSSSIDLVDNPDEIKAGENQTEEAATEDEDAQDEEE